ncbi:MAG TPA: DUF3106 domain-containing protein [Luteimonas sp.]|nr:DUF3106 domain-containing protein [Luteimonas sp.]
MRRLERIVACVALLALATVASALPPALERMLPTLPPAQRDPLLARDAAWSAMTPAQQQALRRRLAGWHALPAATQRQRREQWQLWQALPLEQQLRVRAAAAAFADMPAEQQQQLRRTFAALDRSEQRGWMLGPALGADYVRLQPLLAQVPATQCEPLLALLHNMTVAERGDLAQLAQRTPPQQRDALRRGLLATSAGNRAAWLRLRLEQ